VALFIYIMIDKKSLPKHTHQLQLL
jgi:hypothetical protein